MAGLPRLDKNAIVTVALDGSGDFASLAEALQACDSEATLYLKAGSYYLDDPLHLDKPLSMIGEGSELTRLISTAEGYLLRFRGSGAFVAQGISFEHEGPLWANVVEILSGSINIEDCRFTGGVYGASMRRGGNGLGLYGTTSGTATANGCTGNQRNGIVVHDDSNVTLHQNQCDGNGQSGIHFAGMAAGRVTENICAKNGNNGIIVDDFGHPYMEHNKLQENGWAGIAFQDWGSGTALNNTCSENKGDGIHVAASRDPVRLEANVCQRNERAGISFVRASRGVACDNICVDNRHTGVFVGELANPRLEDNVCQGNGQVGIVFAGGARGKAIGNKCKANGDVDILVTRDAQPVLKANVCREDPDSLRTKQHSNARLRAVHLCVDAIRPLLSIAGSEHYWLANRGKLIEFLRTLERATMWRRIVSRYLSISFHSLNIVTQIVDHYMDKEHSPIDYEQPETTNGITTVDMRYIDDIIAQASAVIDESLKLAGNQDADQRDTNNRLAYTLGVLHRSIDVIASLRTEVETLNTQLALRAHPVHPTNNMRPTSPRPAHDPVQRRSLTVAEAATVIGCHPSNVKYLIRTKQLPAVKRGWQWFLDGESVTTYKRSNRRLYR